MDELEELYQDLILDHAKSPRSFGILQDPDVSSALFNPLCGDEIQLALKFDGETIEEIRFSGHGCSISQAAASMMTELLKGKRISEAKQLCRTYSDMLRGRTEEEALVCLGDLAALQGVRKFSARIKCAMLAWEALEQALDRREKLALTQ